MKLRLDDIFTIESDTYSFMLKQEENKGINEKSGKPIVMTNYWYFPTMNMCLKRYIQESLKSCNDIDAILSRLQRLEVVIDNLTLPRFIRANLWHLMDEMDTDYLFDSRCLKTVYNAK
jgi:hypothetical protein